MLRFRCVFSWNCFVAWITTRASCSLRLNQRHTQKKLCCVKNKCYIESHQFYSKKKWNCLLFHLRSQLNIKYNACFILIVFYSLVHKNKIITKIIESIYEVVILEFEYKLVVALIHVFPSPQCKKNIIYKTYSILIFVFSFVVVVTFLNQRCIKK